MGTDKSHRWIIDPLDGDINFLHGLPLFAISIALEREGQMVAGVVYNPATDDTYLTEKGQGAWYNNHRMRVSGRRDIADALVGCGAPQLGQAHSHARFRAELAAVMARVHTIRSLGAASLDLAMAASGRLDAYWERDLGPCGMAAGILLVKEAGGYVTDASDGEAMLQAGSICAGNETMHRQLLALIKAA